ncbi:MAG TPA: alpha/beta hydrolase [Candidatus Bilamarchaeaceae archaeon]|nr:alpha/beta hydrolase [Candidatus Bilamarchaeaceae archaeon]
MEEKLFLEYAHGQLCALFEPADTKTIVIFCHGLASSKASRINQALRPLLHKDGIATLALDLYAHGESDGKFEQLTISKGYDGLKRAYDFAVEKGYENIVFSGSSFSGVVCLLGAARLDCASFTLKSPVFDYLRLWKTRLGEDGMQKWKEDRYFDIWGRKLGYGFYEDAMRIDVRRITRSIHAPALLVHGDKDDWVPLDHSQEAYTLLQGEKTLHVIRGANHFYKELPHFKEMVTVVHHWLRKKFTVPRGE